MGLERNLVPTGPSLKQSVMIEMDLIRQGGQAKNRRAIQDENISYLVTNANTVSEKRLYILKCIQGRPI